MRAVKVPVVNLGSTGLKVSKLGFGTFDFGVPSLGTTPEEGGGILVGAFKLGINFWDTSDDYGSHPHVAAALKHVPREKIVLSTKTSATSGREAKESLKSSLRELGTDYVDIFLLHWVKADWIDGCRQVLKALKGMKTAGLVKAIGLSTHSVAVVREAARFAELDVLMTICCQASQATMSTYREHIPLEDGALDDMLHALQMAHGSGKGVVAIKVLGDAAPPLVRRYRSSIQAIARLDYVDAMVIGMKSLEEVRKNARAASVRLTQRGERFHGKPHPKVSRAQAAA